MKFRFLTIAFSLMCCAALSARNDGALPFEWVDLQKGAQYATLQTEMFGGDTQCISVFRYPARRFKTDVVNDGGLNEPVKPEYPTAADPSKPATTTSGFAIRYGALAAINGSYFNMGSIFPTTYVVDDRKLESRTVHRDLVRVNGAFGIKRHKIIIMPSDTASYEQLFKGCKDVLAAGPVLMKDGKIIGGWPDTVFYTGRHPRSVIGFNSKGYIYLIVIDGRFPGQGAGMTMDETAELCRLLGLVDAINLDGGGSSALWIKTKGVVSHPYDNRTWDHVGERVVPNAIVVR